MSISNSKPLLFVILLAGLVLTLDRVIWGGGQALLKHSQFRFAALYDGRLNAEVAIFGNSRAVHGFYAPDLTRKFCRPVVSLAYNGIGMETVAALVEDGQTHLGGMKIAVIEVSALFSKDGGSPGFRTFARASPALTARLDQTRETLLPWHQVFRSTALNSDLFYRALIYLNRTDQRWINRGGGVTQDMLRKAQKGQDYALQTAGVAALRQTLIRLKTAGIEPVLIAGPTHSAQRRGAGPQDWPQRLADQLDHPVHNLTATLPDGAGFADPIHLNLQGARALMAHLPPGLSRCAG